MNTQMTKNFSRHLAAGFFAFLLLGSLTSASAAQWTGEFEASLYGAGAGQSGTISDVKAILYDTLGLDVGICSAATSVFVDKGWVEFTCDFDNSNFNGVEIDLVELVSSQVTEIYFTDYVGGAIWQLNSLSGSKQGYFSINLGEEEPEW